MKKLLSIILLLSTLLIFVSCAPTPVPPSSGTEAVTPAETDAITPEQEVLEKYNALKVDADISNKIKDDFLSLNLPHASELQIIKYVTGNFQDSFVMGQSLETVLQTKVDSCYYALIFSVLEDGMYSNLTTYSMNCESITSGSLWSEMVYHINYVRDPGRLFGADTQVQEIYYLIGEYYQTGTFIYYKTNKGDYVWFKEWHADKREGEEWFLPVDEMYAFLKDRYYDYSFITEGLECEYLLKRFPREFFLEYKDKNDYLEDQFYVIWQNKFGKNVVFQISKELAVDAKIIKVEHYDRKPLARADFENSGEIDSIFKLVERFGIPISIERGYSELEFVFLTDQRDINCWIRWDNRDGVTRKLFYAGIPHE